MKAMVLTGKSNSALFSTKREWFFSISNSSKLLILFPVPARQNKDCANIYTAYICKNEKHQYFFFFFQVLAVDIWQIVMNLTRPQASDVLIFILYLCGKTDSAF